MSSLTTSEKSSGFDLQQWKSKCYAAMNDDFNSPLLIASLFDAVKYINGIANGLQQISSEDLIELSALMNAFFYDVLGLLAFKNNTSNETDEKLDGSLQLIMELRNKARLNKDFETSDLIRDSLSKLNIQINDTSEGTLFKIN